MTSESKIWLESLERLKALSEQPEPEPEPTPPPAYPQVNDRGEVHIDWPRQDVAEAENTKDPAERVRKRQALMDQMGEDEYDRQLRLLGMR